MNIAFWNGIGSRQSIADYVVAIGTILAMEQKSNVVLGSNYIANHMLQDAFSSKMLEEGCAHTPYCFLFDTPEYNEALWNMKQNRQGSILEVPQKGITIIFPPDVAEKRMFYYKSPPQSFYLLDMAKKYNASSQSALDEAEAVIVFLSKNATDIHNFFERFSSLVPKTLFVMVDYHRGAGYSCRKLESDYGIKRRNIIILPYNCEYEEACKEGKLEIFLEKNKKRSTREANYKLIASLRRIVKHIYKWENIGKEKEREDEQRR